MTVFDRLKELCRSETRNAPSGADDPAYKEWLGGKKPLTNEALAGHWIVKIGDQCGGYLAQLRDAQTTRTKRD
jgi:hypothetical protein